MGFPAEMLPEITAALKFVIGAAGLKIRIRYAIMAEE